MCERALAEWRYATSPGHHDREFGPRKLYANLGRAAGQDDDDAYALS